METWKHLKVDNLSFLLTSWWEINTNKWRTGFHVVEVWVAPVAKNSDMDSHPFSFSYLPTSVIPIGGKPVVISNCSHSPLITRVIGHSCTRTQRQGPAVHGPQQVELFASSISPRRLEMTAKIIGVETQRGLPFGPNQFLILIKAMSNWEKVHNENYLRYDLRTSLREIMKDNCMGWGVGELGDRGRDRGGGRGGGGEREREHWQSWRKITPL